MEDLVMPKKYERIRNLREDKDISQTIIANYLNVNQKTYSRYETGEAEPAINTVRTLASYFNVSLDWLAGNSEIKDPHINSNNLLNLYNSLSNNQKEQVFTFINYLIFMNNTNLIKNL